MKNTCLKVAVVCAVLGFFSANPLQALEFNLVDGQPIRTQADVDALKTGDTLVLMCAKCKTGTMTTYSTDAGSAGHVNWLQPGNKTACSCGGTMKTVKVGDKYKLVCSKCGDMGFVTAFKTAQR